MQVNKPHYTTTSTADKTQVNKLSPKTKEELSKIIEERIKKEGYDCDLNDIDVSHITDMNSLFAKSKFNGHIENWDVSNVTDMSLMFYRSNFNGDLSRWDTSNVTNMYLMFCYASFNQDISKWNVTKVHDHTQMFTNCPMENKLKYQPKFRD